MENSNANIWTFYKCEVDLSILSSKKAKAKGRQPIFKCLGNTHLHSPLKAHFIFRSPLYNFWRKSFEVYDTDSPIGEVWQLKFYCGH